MKTTKTAAAKTHYCTTVATFEGPVFYNFGPYALATIAIVSPRTGATLTARVCDLPAALVARVQETMFYIAENVLEHDASGLYDADEAERAEAFAGIERVTVGFTSAELSTFATVARRAA